MGLDIGADDYIVKPFSPSEVMARVRAVMRRMNMAETGQGQNSDNKLVIKDLTINMDEYSLYIGKEKINLTKKEIEKIERRRDNNKKKEEEITEDIKELLD